MRGNGLREKVGNSSIPTLHMTTQLINIETNEQGQKLVSGRELHEVLGIKVHFSTWLKRMCEYGFQENIDFSILKSDNPNGGIAKIGDYILTLDMAKHIAMILKQKKS